jgi:hypothetical protein
MVLGHLWRCHIKGTCPGPDLLRTAAPLRRGQPGCPHRTAEQPPSPRSPQMRQRGTARRPPTRPPSAAGRGHQPRQVLDVTGELGDEGQLPLLPGGPRLRHPVYSKRQRLVVAEDAKLPFLQHAAEVSDRQVRRQQFPIKSRIFLLGSLQLLAEEGQGGPCPTLPLLQDSSHMLV